MKTMEKKTTNTTKYNAYKQAFTLIEAAKHKKDLPYAIASIAIAESIISDRAESFLDYKEQEWLEKEKNRNGFIATSKLIRKCKAHYPTLSLSIKRRTGELIQTEALFEEINKWLMERNTILHSFAKSRPGTPTMKQDDYFKKAIRTSEEGLRLTLLLKKWFNQQKRKSLK